MGKSAYQASIDAADEIGLAVVATTFSIVAVFLPVGLMPGISGQFFKNFGLTVVVSVLMSLAVARMITPMVAAYFLKAKGHQDHATGPLMDRYMKILHWSINADKAHEYRKRLIPAPSSLAYHVMGLLMGAAGFVGFLFGMEQIGAEVGFLAVLGGLFAGFLPGYLIGALLTFIIGLGMGLITGFDSSRFTIRTRYLGQRLIARTLDHRVWMMGIGIFSLGLTGVIGMNIPQQFFPSADSDFSMVRVNMVPGTTLEQTEEVIGKVAERLKQEQEVELALEIVNEGSGMVRLVLKPDRERTSLEFEREMTPVMQSIPDARVNFQSGQGGGGGSGRAITIMLSGSDPAKLDSAAAVLVEEMKDVNGLVAPRIEVDLRRPELIITPHHDLAQSLGVSTQALSQAIRIATLGDIDQNAAKFSLSDRQIPIRVRLAEDQRRSLDTIRNLPVPTGTGGSVPLARVADIEFGSGPTSIQRYNQNRRVFVSADIARDAARGDVYSAVLNLPIMRNLPTGVSNTPVGEDQWQGQLANSFGIALFTAFGLVFSVLVLLYRRLVSPLVNMGSLLLAPLGGLVALLILGQPISLPVFIGILMLFGIVAKNSILLIDFALEEMDSGKSKDEAIIEAGHKRAQPIVMTTVAMTAGMVPTALSLTGDSAWRAPMGTVVIGGLILSTLLTLLIVPAGFSLADGVEKRFGPWLRDRLLTYKPGDGHGHKPEVQPAE
jgi:multidrug efflux pump subunit AcrB